MSVSNVSKMSVQSLTPLNYICQWLYKIVSKSIYRVYLKSIIKKKSIKKIEREYRNPLTADKSGQSLIGQWLALSVRALTKVLTTDKTGEKIHAINPLMLLVKGVSCVYTLLP